MSATATALDNAAPGLVRLNGQWRVRRMGWILANQPITCCNKHYLEDTGGHELHPCPHRSSSHSTPCNARVWVHRGSHGRLWLADVSHEEIRMFRERELNVDGVLRYLGAAL